MTLELIDTGPVVEPVKEFKIMKHSNNRSHFEMLLAVLVMLRERGPTINYHLFYGCRMSHTKLNKFVLPQLIESQLITTVMIDKRVHYTLTAKGLETLDQARYLVELFVEISGPIV